MQNHIEIVETEMGSRPGTLRVVLEIDVLRLDFKAEQKRIQAREREERHQRQKERWRLLNRAGRIAYSRLRRLSQNHFSINKVSQQERYLVLIEVAGQFGLRLEAVEIALTRYGKAFRRRAIAHRNRRILQLYKKGFEFEEIASRVLPRLSASSVPMIISRLKKKSPHRKTGIITTQIEAVPQKIDSNGDHDLHLRPFNWDKSFMRQQRILNIHKKSAFQIVPMKCLTK